jgi:ribosomal protein L7Ae-like RNA K-turn-binding protein
MIERACARNLFAKAARGRVRLPDDLLAQTERALRRRCLALIGLARRSGQTAAGFVQVKERLSAGEAALLLEARDSAGDGRRRIAALAKAGNPDLPVATPFTAEELGRALGRNATVHLLILPGGLAERLKTEVARLAAVADEAAEDRGKLDS